MRRHIAKPGRTSPLGTVALVSVIILSIAGTAVAVHYFRHSTPEQKAKDALETWEAGMKAMAKSNPTPTPQANFEEVKRHWAIICTSVAPRSEHEAEAAKGAKKVQAFLDELEGIIDSVNDPDTALRAWHISDDLGKAIMLYGYDVTATSENAIDKRAIGERFSKAQLLAYTIKGQCAPIFETEKARRAR